MIRSGMAAPLDGSTHSATSADPAGRVAAPRGQGSKTHMKQGAACNGGRCRDLSVPASRSRDMNGKLGWALAMVILTAAACSKQAARVSVSARAETPADGGTNAGCAGLSLNGGDVCVTDVQIEIRKVKLEGPANENANADAGAANDGSGHMLVADQKGSTDSGEDVDEDNEVRVGPCPLHLSGSDLQAGILSPTICAGDVPDGTYNELRIVIAPIDAAADA